MLRWELQSSGTQNFVLGWVLPNIWREGSVFSRKYKAILAAILMSQNKDDLFPYCKLTEWFL